MFTLTLLMLMLGVANWFATTLIVESELFRPLRNWVAGRMPSAKPETFRQKFWSKAGYLVACHMCTGTWVGLAMALFAPSVLPGTGLAGFLVTALVIKGVGHLVLLLNNMGNAAIERYRAQAAEAAMRAMPDLGDLLSGLMSRRHESHAADSDHKDKYEQQAGTYMFPNTFSVPKKRKHTFEPLDDDAFTKPETKF